MFSQSTEESYGSWSTLLLDYDLNDQFYLKNEVHFRRTNFLSDWQQLLIRPSVNYKLNEVVSFSVGYTYAKNYRNEFDFNEHNAWEQVMLSHSSGASSFKHRFRFEQRFVDEFTQQPTGEFLKDETDYLHRFRYRFTWSMPLITVQEGKKISVSVFDEIWLNADEGIVPRSLNQNWFYIGLAYPISNNAAFELGYMNDYAPLGANQYRSNHVLQTTLKYSIN